MPPDTIALYIHWPYCARICPYCDFNVYKARDDDALLPAMLVDLAGQAATLGTRQLSSIHFGGGTPSLMPPETVAALIKAATDKFTPAPDMEIALEANPDGLDKGKLTALRDAGINRLSLGVQSFQDRALVHLGRTHDGAQARRVAEQALATIPNTSLDLIFGWAGQGADDWQADLDIALALAPPHISTYQLTIEPGTAFARADARGQSPSTSSDASADYYEMASETLTQAGYEHYEVSNFARPGYRSRHNLAYWRTEDYLGIGPGAHGRITTGDKRLATLMPAHPRDYVSDPVPAIESLSPTDRASEYVLMGLRTDEGIDPAVYEHLAGEPLSWAGLEEYLQIENGRLIATPQGRRVLDSLISELLV